MALLDPSSRVTMTPMSLVEAITSPPVGQYHLASGLFSSASGRHVIARYWQPEADCGEPVTGGALIEPFRGAIEEYDTLVALDPTQHVVVFRSGAHLWLLDTGTGEREDLARRGADVADDRGSPWESREGQYRNLGRQVSFDALGQRMSYLLQDPDRVVVRTLATGDEQVYPIPGRIEQFSGSPRVWRAEPGETPEHIRVFVVESREVFAAPARSRAFRFLTRADREAPRICGFAMAQGVELNRLSAVQLDIWPDGRFIERPADRGAGRTYDMGGGWLLRRPATELYDPRGEWWSPRDNIGPPHDDGGVACFPVAGVVIVPEERDTAWVRPSTGETVWLGQRSAHAKVSTFGGEVSTGRENLPLFFPDHQGRHWVNVVRRGGERRNPFNDQMQQFHIQGRLCLQTRELHWLTSNSSPSATPSRTHHPWKERSPWRTASNDQATFAFNLVTGHVQKARFPPGITLTGEPGRRKKDCILAPSLAGFYFHDHPYPVDQNAAGCVLLHLGESEAREYGPWQLVAPKVLAGG